MVNHFLIVLFDALQDIEDRKQKHCFDFDDAGLNIFNPEEFMKQVKYYNLPNIYHYEDFIEMMKDYGFLYIENDIQNLFRLDIFKPDATRADIKKLQEISFPIIISNILTSISNIEVDKFRASPSGDTTINEFGDDMIRALDIHLATMFFSWSAGTLTIKDEILFSEAISETKAIWHKDFLEYGFKLTKSQKDGKIILAYYHASFLRGDRDKIRQIKKVLPSKLARELINKILKGNKHFAIQDDWVILKPNDEDDLSISSDFATIYGLSKPNMNHDDLYNYKKRVARWIDMKKLRLYEEKYDFQLKDYKQHMYFRISGIQLEIRKRRLKDEYVFMKNLLTMIDHIAHISDFETAWIVLLPGSAKDYIAINTSNFENDRFEVYLQEKSLEDNYEEIIKEFLQPIDSSTSSIGSIADFIKILDRYNIDYYLQSNNNLFGIRLPNYHIGLQAKYIKDLKTGYDIVHNHKDGNYKLHPKTSNESDENKRSENNDDLSAYIINYIVGKTLELKKIYIKSDDITQLANEMRNVLYEITQTVDIYHIIGNCIMTGIYIYMIDNHIYMQIIENNINRQPLDISRQTLNLGTFAYTTDLAEREMKLVETNLNKQEAMFNFSYAQQIKLFKDTSNVDLHRDALEVLRIQFDSSMRKQRELFRSYISGQCSTVYGNDEIVL